MKLTVCCCLFLTLHFEAFAQKSISGKVIADGLPLPGVTVKVKSTSKAAQTDVNGQFKIAAKADDVLIFSFLGYNNLEAAINNRDQINVELKASAKNLNEVVVVGYGTQKRKDVTSSIATLNSSTYKDQPVVSASSALQGRVAGVSVTNSSGAPGAQSKIRIRGGNSVNANNDPLYVVDGVALSSIGLQNINVNDIESMDILKDASATATYGSRGANGVVIVTTKTGRSGTTKVGYNGFVGFNQAMEQYDLMDPVTYAELANYRMGKEVFADPQSFAGKGTDWQSLVFRKALTQNHQLSISGGTEKGRYYISGNYLDQQGILENSEYKRYSLRSNLDARLTDKLSIGVNILAERSDAHNNGDIGTKGNAVMGALAWAPTEQIYDDAASSIYNRNGISPIWTNPYMNIREANTDQFNNVALLNGKLKYTIVDGLTLAVNAGLDYNSGKSAYLRNQWIAPGNMASGQGMTENYTFQNSNILTFNRTIGEDHDVTVTALAESISNTVNGFNANGSGLTSTNNGYYNLGLNTQPSINSSYLNSSLLSFMGRVAYSYKGKYLLTASLRRDGSSKFSDDNKWGTFPSVSLGWNVSEESFLKDVEFLSDLKIRGSYGITGNQGIAPYSTLGAMTAVNYSYGTGTAIQGYLLGNPQTPDVKWETTSQTDIGVDVGFFSGRLTLAADYYSKNTSDLLLFTRINDYDGGGSLLRNIGEVSNKGFEFMINATPVKTENFTWNASVNAATNKNKVLSLGDDDMIFRSNIGGGLITTQIQTVKVGESLGSFYLIPWEGIYQSDDASLGFKAGDNKYTDVDGNGSIGFEDRTIAGSAIPTFTWGFNNSFSFKNFDLNIFFQGAQGNKIFNATYAATAVPSSDVAYPTLAETANYWTPQNSTAPWANPSSKTGRSYIESTQFLQDGSYIRLKNISLSYTLPKRLLKNFTTARFTVSAQNYLTISKYKGYDPEASSTPASSDADAGIDMGAYPSPKTITLGLNLDF